MSLLTMALDLAAKGFYVFPLRPGSKLPAIKQFTEKASRDVDQLEEWFANTENNLGIITSKFGDSEALLVVDVDVKGKHNGFDSLRELGLSPGDTLTQDTPSGGCHLIFRAREAVRQSVGAFGGGIDIRSRGGYIVGPGSRISGKTYAFRAGDLCVAPPWLVEKCVVGKTPQEILQEPVVGNATERARRYLATAPVAVEGSGGNHTTYRVAAQLKDLGVTVQQAKTLMCSTWNTRCVPPWTHDDLCAIIDNAYRYGQDTFGSRNPEVVFDDQEEMPGPDNLHPFERLNKDYAFVIAGGGHHIIWENADRIEHLNEQTFHKKFASQLMEDGEKLRPVTQLWMKDKRRRSYDGFVFKPGLEVPKNMYNLWRGFAVKECEGEAKHESLDKFLEHARENVCGGDEKLFRWLIGYFAHLVQRPWEKPLVALVFRGKKGVGKNALVDRIGHLLGNHYLSTADRRYLVGNFNGHMENCLLFTLDEAFWSGDKQAEGVLKSVITSKTHNIEHKGKEIYSVDNCTRVVILGNEDWLVPASHDERRYAVFQVGEGRKQDRRFFESMRVGMENGGYAHLLKFLATFDLSGHEVNQAPLTKALLEQKEESLDIIDRWWLQCLRNGYVDEDMDWPNAILTSTLRTNFRAFCQSKNYRSRLPDDMDIGKRLKELCPAVHRMKKRDKGTIAWAYSVPELSECRSDWEKRIGHEMEWE